MAVLATQAPPPGRLENILVLFDVVGRIFSGAAMGNARRSTHPSHLSCNVPIVGEKPKAFCNPLEAPSIHRQMVCQKCKAGTFMKCSGFLKENLSR